MMNIRLEKPKHGWSQLHIGDWHGDLSYVGDPASELLEAVNNVLVKSKPYVVRLDAEDHEYWVVFDLFDIHVICEPAPNHTVLHDYELHSFKITINAAANALVEQIDADFDEWATFPCYLDTEEECRRHRNQLDMLLGLVRYRAKTKGVPNEETVL